MADILKKDMLRLWAETGDIVPPADEKISEGWAVEVVPRQWWNWMQNRVDSNVAYMLQKGIPEWDGTTEYISGKSYVQHNNVIYKSIQTGTNQNPATATAYWQKALVESSASMEAIKAVVPSADTIAYFTGATTAASTSLTSFARTLLDDADAATARGTLGAQQVNTALTAISGVTPATDTIAYFNGTTTAASTGLSSFGRTLIDDLTAAAARTTLGLSNSATIAATNLNTGNTIVQRDASGNFSAGTITASLSGNATTATTATTANALTTARTISLEGDVTGSTYFNGSANVSITAIVADDSHNHIIANVDGLQTALDGKQAALGFTPVQQGGGIDQGTNKVYIGWAADASGLMAQVDSTNFGVSWPINITKNAATATALQTARSISLAGDVTGSASFDGSANISITATVADDSHNHIISNVDGLQAALDLKVSKDSIVGTVSQSGGIPTGAIIERGSNANGEYVRFADGTQICMKKDAFSAPGVTSPSGSVYTSAESAWNYPAAFTGDMVALIPIRTAFGGAWCGAGSNPNTGNTGYSVLMWGASLAVPVTWDGIAVGRWY